MRRIHAILLAVIATTLLATGCATQSQPRQLAWDVVTMKDDDWSGAPRQTPLIQGDSLILRGKEIRTESSYSPPVTVEFDAMLEERVANDGAVACVFVPTTQAVDRDTERGVYVSFQYNSEGDALAVHERFQRWPTHKGKNWSRTPLSIKSDGWHHLKYQVTKEDLLITVDGQACSSGGAVVPYDSFYVYLFGWQPANRWHVRNFSIH
jgi:hypothetical protein